MFHLIQNQNIKKVILRKRLENRYLKATWKIQVRIGNTDNRRHRRSRITSNSACGGIIPSNWNYYPTITYICSSPLSGRYLTTQVFDDIYMELSDLEVYTYSRFMQKCITCTVHGLS